MNPQNVKAATLDGIENFVHDLGGSLTYQSPFIFRYIFILSYEIFQHSVIHIQTQDYNIIFLAEWIAFNLQFRILLSL